MLSILNLTYTLIPGDLFCLEERGNVTLNRKFRAKETQQKSFLFVSLL